MKIDKLTIKNVRNSETAPKITTLDDESLRNVVGGDLGFSDPNCPIHFNYPSDITA